MISVLVGGVVGLAVAPGLRAVAARYAVECDEPLAVCCPVGRWWRAPSGRCRGCGGRSGPGAWRVEAVAGAVGAALGSVTHGPSMLLLAWVGLFGVVLAFVDAAVQRLPDPLTLALALGTAAILVSTVHQEGVLLRCLCAALAVGAGFWVLALLGMGPGDAKLVPSLAAALAWYGWGSVLAGVFLGSVLAALWAGASRLPGRREEREVAFGPWLLLGSLLAVLLAG